ncbi:MAG: PASTA domain-containing protein [Pygmaiobacter massiliensis]|nr:PASTA domain-containing protein [Pygmaiobacter massiliensis]
MGNERFCINCHSAFPADAAECPFCKTGTANENPGGALPSSSVLAGKYTIGHVKELDGEGIYYEAFHNETRMPVLIKEYLPVTLCSKRDADGTVVVREGSEVPYKTTLVDFVDFYKELMRLSGRPGIARIESLFKANNTVYVVFRAEKSITLTEWLNRQTELIPFEESLALLQPVLLGLSAMHELGLVHRGVCPDNIHITQDGKTFLMGYATLSLRSMNSDLKPTLYDGYSAPEQYSNTEFQGPYTDVYSIAAVLYKMAAGTAPQAAAGGSCPTLKQVGADVPNFVSRAIDAAMQPNVRARTQNISTLRLALEEGAEGGVGHLHRSAASVVKSEKRSASALPFDPKYLLFGALGVVVVVAVLWLIISSMLPKRGTDSSSSVSSQVSSSQSVPASSQAAVDFGTAPNYLGTKYADIQANQQAMSQYVFTTSEAYSDTYSKGVVMSQTPAAGEKMTSNTIHLVISKGPNTVTVPNIMNLSTGDVVKMLQEAGIENYTFVTKTNDGTMVEGTSVEVSPAVGNTLNLETDTLTVFFAGPAPTPTSPPTSSETSSSEIVISVTESPSPESTPEETDD